MKVGEFKVNKYITLRMEGENTIIYVAGRKFRQCKALSIEIPLDNLTSLEKMKSIDEVIEKMNTIDKKPSLSLSPEEEFWGHCSSLEIWAENDYNTNLLHSSLAFPLLVKLTSIGDPIAGEVLKKELIKKMSSGFFPTIMSLVNANYPYYYFTPYDYEITFLAMKEKLSEEQLRQIISHEAEVSSGGGYLSNYEYLEIKYSLNSHDIKLIKEIEHHIGRFLPYCDDLSLKGPFFYSENNEIYVLALDNSNITYLPKCISNLKSLITLRANNNKLKEVLTSIGELKNLSILGLHNNALTSLPESIIKLTKLDVLLLSNNKLTEFPSVISSLKNLKCLRIRKNKIYKIPNALKSLKELEILDLGNNKFTEIPSSIFNLLKLKELSLNNNLISNIPEEIINLKNLEHLNLNNNQLKEIPQFLYELKSLTSLRIEKNQMNEKVIKKN